MALEEKRLPFCCFLVFFLQSGASLDCLPSAVFLIFRMVFLLFRNFFRKFAVPGPLFFWSPAGVSRFRSLYFQSSFPFCPLVFPFPRAVSAVSPCNFSLFPGFFEVIGRTSERVIYIIKVYRKTSFQLV